MIAFSITWCLCYQVLRMQNWIVVTKNTHNLTTKHIHVDWWEKSPVQNPDPGIWPWDWWRLLLFETRSQHVSVTTGKGTGWLLLWVTVAVQSCDPPPHPTAQTCALKGWGHVTARPSTFPGLSGSSLWGWDANPHKPSITHAADVLRGRRLTAGTTGLHRTPSTSLCCGVVMESSTNMAGNWGKSSG